MASPVWRSRRATAPYTRPGHRSSTGPPDGHAPAAKLDADLHAGLDANLDADLHAGLGRQPGRQPGRRPARHLHADLHADLDADLHAGLDADLDAALVKEPLAPSRPGAAAARRPSHGAVRHRLLRARAGAPACRKRTAAVA
ncbi:MAG: hypothetical protein ACREIR_08600 [Geminicoccaceae bacterium]